MIDNYDIEMTITKLGIGHKEAPQSEKLASALGGMGTVSRGARRRNLCTAHPCVS